MDEVEVLEEVEELEEVEDVEVTLSHTSDNWTLQISTFLRSTLMNGGVVVCQSMISASTKSIHCNDV